MSDFSVRITSGATVQPWTDPATASAPTRLNPNPEHPHKYLHVDKDVVSLTLKATVGGVEGPADSELGGRLFKWSWVETPTTDPPVISPQPSYSSILIFTGSPFANKTGHYTILCWREGGGAQGLTFEVRA